MKWSLVIRYLFLVFCVYSSTQGEMTCTVPTIENAKRLEKVGARLQYQCNPGYEPEGFVITCNQQGDWDHMNHCTAKSFDCGPPPSIEDAVQDLKEQYKDGETVSYECPSDYVKTGDLYLTCRQGRWTGNGECMPKTLDCGRPPSIKDAVQDYKEQYKDGETAAYDCPAYYVKTGDPHLTCRRGRWTGNGQCMQPCTVDVQEMDARYIKLAFRGRTKIYSKHEDFISFVCKERRKPTGTVAFRQQCLNGVINLPACE